ncbi:sensor domain-containing diguanylate cyclase [Shewanella sp. MMG014]|uniref:sensor domain-containing diguanylate cyclase n=1 Tax=Shewanella sp. MMG014 TaxID=2822691 RepID=UPI001B3821ED|nr:sensor domain-containing diguanylate cyclase [Shewanella sp. MMG014]MBQ4891091.1 sensor domain-containing diguanylate cyclase [Shewanella sp. MMG014]
MTNESSSELVIRRLYQVTQDHSKGFEHQLLELLKMGLERFDLDIAILSKIDQNKYVVKYCVTPDEVPLNPNDCFDLNATYCSMTCNAKGPVGIEHMGEDDALAVHPAYQAFGLESYIGIPIRLNGQLYGTLNFSSPTPYPRMFRDVDIDALQLMASWVEVELIRREQEAQLKALNKELHHLANFDSLTNVPNRRGMHQTLHKDLNRLSRSQGHGTIALLDIDRFKQLNDTYGHQAGDDALVAIAEKITQSLRDYDFVARFGGEEFLLWLPDTAQEECSIVCKRVMENIATIGITAEPITVSIGACHFRFNQFKPDDMSKLIDNIISEADTVLYEAKAQGRNRLNSVTKVLSAD